MHKSKTQSKIPSFSSSLLDEIYNSIEAKNPKAQPFFFSDYMPQKQSTRTGPVDRKIHRDRLFGSRSSSSDSNSSVFSSSDTEVMYGRKNSSRPSCFGPSRNKPRKTEDNALFYGNRAFRASNEYGYSSGGESITRREEIWKNPRNRPAKITGNWKTVKTPVSPGGKIVSFLNSLFNNTRKPMAARNSNSRTQTNYSSDYVGFAGKSNGNSSACSSASSFSRSCLNKKLPEKSSDAAKRSVKFAPINVIVPENPTGVEKSAFWVEEDDDGISTRLMSAASITDALSIRKLQQKRRTEDEGRRSVEEIAREFLREYCKNQNKNNTIKNNDYNDDDVLYDYDQDEDDGDDEASDASSDLFELDLAGNHYDRYRDELPVYETTCAGLIS